MGCCVSLHKRRFVQQTPEVEQIAPPTINSTTTDEERLKKQLNPYGREILLKQALRFVDDDGYTLSHLFAKIMLANKKFLNTARRRRTYRFVINVDKDTTILGFIDQSQHFFSGFELHLEEATRLINLLKPTCTNMTVHLKRNETSEFLSLSSAITTGKFELAFVNNPKIAPHQIECNWSKVDILECYASVIPPHIPPKQLEFLSVHRIGHMRDMRKVLRHNAKQLHLHIKNTYFNIIEKPIEEIGNVDSYFIHGDGLSLLHAIQTISLYCSSAKQLNVVSSYNVKQSNQYTVTELIESIVQEYTFYNKLVQRLYPLKINSTIDFERNYFGDNFKLQKDWMNDLMSRPDFPQIKHKTEVVNGEVTTVFENYQKIGALNANFSIKLTYQYVEVPEIVE